MRRLVSLWLLVYLGVSIVSLSAGFNFSHKDSTVRIGSSKFIINKQIQNWNGTLDHSGSIVGLPISFSDGILTANGTSAIMTGTYDGDSPRKVTFNSGHSLRVDAGAFSPKITVLRGSNRLEGQPLFSNSDSINLTHQLSDLTIAIQTALNSNVVLNNGSLTLGSNLAMGDDYIFSGSGTINLNRHKLSLGGKKQSLAHQILWNNASDIQLNGPTLLSGRWTFTGSEAHINGNGNVLDLTTGGTLWIRAGTKLYLSGVKLRGVGLGQIVFENKNSQLRLSDVEIEVARNYSVTTGCMYAEGATKIITGNKTLTFSQQGTFSIDQVTVVYDTLTSADTNNIQPLIGASGNPGGKNVASVKSGTICHLDCGLGQQIKNNSNAIISNAVCCRVNSNALLYLNKNSSNAILNLNKKITNNSNAIISNAVCCRVNSNALLYLNKNSSNAILNLNKKITNNSNAIIANAVCCRVNSNALLYLNKNSSNAILNLNKKITNNSNAIISNAVCCRVNSNALLYLNKNTSNTELRLFKNNSDAILKCCKSNSDAILNLNKKITNNSNAIISNAVCCRVNSNALLYLNKNSSNAILNLNKKITNNSNAIISNAVCCRVNSNALLYLNKNSSNAILNLNKKITNNSNAIISNAVCCRVNSNALLYLNKNTSNTELRLFKNNSDAILKCCKSNSDAILNLNKKITNNSNAIISNAVCCRVNSNALLYLNKNTSNTELRLFKNNSDAILALKKCCSTNTQNITNNSNSIINLINNNSANLICCRVNSNAILYLTNNNSNAILALKKCCTTNAQNITNNSNAIINLVNNSNSTDCCRYNSNAILYLTNNNSNAILALKKCCTTNAQSITNNSNAIINFSSFVTMLPMQNSNAILALKKCCSTNAQNITNNSNAIINLVNNSNSIDCCRYNSNAILYLTNNNSNAILALKKCCTTNVQNITNNSNAIINLINNNSANLICCRVNSNAILYLTNNNSNAILALKKCCTTNGQNITNNSNAIINLINNNSANLICCRVNSNAILYLTNNNSNAILALKKCCTTNVQNITNNSNAIINFSSFLSMLPMQNSNAILALKKCCSTNAQNITNNSNAIINLVNNSNSTECCRYNSNAILYLTNNNSNAILNLKKCCTTNVQNITNNSNAIINLVNSNSANMICCRVNSNAILYLTKNNSNAILECCKDNSNALLECCKNNSNAILNCCKNSSNTILYLTTNNSNAILACCKNNSNALLECCKNNSNAILNCCKNSSNTILYLTTNNSNAILNCCKNNSNTLLDCCRENSNALISLFNNVSNTVLYLTNNNSNALLACCKNNSNALLECCKNNSNAIVKLEAELHCCTLVQAPVTTDVLMNCNCIVDPIKVVNVVNTLTIDGQGAWIEFCNPTTPQFIVAAGATVTLQNVTLMRINANTFSLGAGATIVLGDNVTFELEDDLTLNGEAFTVGGTVDNPFVWTIRGIGGKRRLILTPNAAAGQYITLGFNTLLLQEVELEGVESIAIARGLDAGGTLVVGALGLGGGAEMNLGQNTDATFVVEGNRNSLRMLDTGLALTGFILYSDIFDSELHLTFHLQDPIVGNPSVTFGPDLLFLSSAAGRASIIFDDFWAIVANQNGNSFVTDANAFIGGRNVELNGFPIKQTSADLILDSGLNLRSDQPNAIDQSFIRGPLFRKQPRTHVITALDIRRMREYEHMQDNIAASNRPAKPKASSNRERQKQNKHGRKRQTCPYARELAELVAEHDATRSLAHDAQAHFQAIKNYVQEQINRHKVVKREFVLPTTFQLEQGGSVVKVENASNNVLIHTGGVGSDFGIDPVNQLNLYLGNNISGDGTVRQGFKDTTLKPNDKIFVRNLNNRIQIQEHFTIQGEIVMTPASELVFEFLDNGKDPVLFFDANHTDFFDIPHDSLVRFIGRGKVIFGDGFTMRLEGGKLTPEKTKMIFDESVLVTLGEGESTVIIDGDGKLLFDRGAQLNIRAGQHLIIGRLDEPTLPPDGIDITLDREAEWNLNEDLDGDDVREGDARLSIIGSSTFSLRVDDEAKVYIGNQGVLEMNAFFNERLEVPGVVTSLAFVSKGTLSFENGGRFVLGLNKDFVKTFVDTKKGILQTDGSGIAQFAARNDSVTVRLSNGSLVNQGNAFAGLVQESDLFIGLKGSFTGRDIIRRLMNLVPTLSFSTVFRGGDLNQGLELLGGEGSIQSKMFIVQLDVNDFITNDDAAAGLVVGFNGNGNLFTIDQAGNRTVSRVIAEEADLEK